jgi:tRNA (cytidine/uridine-2'-O-)-methyltransferase
VSAADSAADARTVGSRVPRVSPLFSVILHEPEIPNNTGNIGRTCVATGCALHLVHPLGFDTSEKACRRAGLDYWPRLGVREHASWDACLAALAPPADRLWLFTSYATRPVFDAPLRRGDFLVFGKETAGFPPDMLDRYRDRLLLLPMVPEERSLNVATAVCAVVYEGLRQALARGEASLDPAGRLML